MRKSIWVGLTFALVIAGLFIFLEQRRGAYFLTSTSGPAVDETPLDYKLAFFMQRAEWGLLDARFKLRGGRPPHPDIMIIAIDEKSLNELHQWPWSRGVHARLIRTLAAAPPRALAFDVLFVEPFTSDLQGDAALAEATRQNPWVVHSLFFTTDRGQVQGIKLPYQALLEAADHLGYVNAFIDEDGVLRAALPQMQVQDQFLSLLSLDAASLYLRKPEEDILKDLPLDKRKRWSINFAGPDYTFPYYSYADVLSGKIPVERFRGKIVLVGASATGTFDHYPTPLSKFMPGVEFHASVIDNILHLNALRYAGLRVTYGAIAGAALLCAFVLIRFSAWAGVLGVLLTGAGYGGLAQWLFTRRMIVIDMAGPLLVLFFSYGVMVIYRFFTEEREKRWVKAAFGQYVSPKVLEVLMADPSKLQLGGERREVSVFFSDVEGFTSISERLDPEALVSLLNRYLTAMTEVIFQHDGYLNKYMGDGIMAFWNAPVKQADHAARACRCALQSQERLKALNAELQSQGIAPLRARIGINSGTVVVGNMGSAQKSDYTVMGDAVNLGSRLEGENKSFHTSIMISEFTYEQVRDLFDVRLLGPVQVRGKEKAVNTYELLAEKKG